MIYDCFTFFNELDLLEIRLNELSDVVDKFVIVEATKTFTGQPKPLCFADNKERFAAFSDRIIYVIVDDMPETGDAWNREYHQRNAIMRGLGGSSPEDWILISDVDEIPRPDKIGLMINGINIFEQSYNYHFLNVVCQNPPFWYQGTRGLLRSDLKSPQEIRMSTGQIIRNGGWHFSYLGGVEAIRQKLNAFSHQEYNTPLYTDPDFLLRCIAEGRDIFGREYQWKFRPIDDTFPKYVLDNLDRFDHLILDPVEMQKKIDATQTVPFSKFEEVVIDAQVQINAIRNEGYKKNQLLNQLSAKLAENDQTIKNLVNQVEERDKIIAQFVTKVTDIEKMEKEYRMLKAEKAERASSRHRHKSK